MTPATRFAAVAFLLALAAFPARATAVQILRTRSGSEFEVQVADRGQDGLVVLYRGERALVRWKNIDWLSGTAVFTMKNGKPLVFYCLRRTDTGWIVRPSWAPPGTEFEITSDLVKGVRTPLEIEREYVQRRAAMDLTRIADQFEMLKWCLLSGRDDLALSHAQALRETRNAWNLAVTMQATLVGVPRAEVPGPGQPDREKFVLQTLWRTVVQSADRDRAPFVGHRILAFDLAAGRIEAPGKEVRQWLEMLYRFATAATRARTDYQEARQRMRRRVQCPKCRGSGEVRGRYIGRTTDKRLGIALSGGSAVDVRDGFEILQCNRCGGAGHIVEVNELPDGPAGLKSILPPERWDELTAATEGFLDSRPPQELMKIQLPAQ
jgi:hypothetical protein